MGLFLGLVAPTMCLLTMLWSDAAALILGTPWNVGALLALISMSVLLVLSPLVGVVVAFARKRRAPAVLGLLAPIAALAAVYLTLMLFPSQDIVNARLGTPSLVAIREATAASVTLNLRPGGRFDLVIRSFGITSFHQGRYERSGDDYRFDFAGHDPGGFSEHAVTTGTAIVFDSGPAGGAYALEIVASGGSTGEGLR